MNIINTWNSLCSRASFYCAVDNSPLTWWLFFISIDCYVTRTHATEGDARTMDTGDIYIHFVFSCSCIIHEDLNIIAFKHTHTCTHTHTYTHTNTHIHTHPHTHTHKHTHKHAKTASLSTQAAWLMFSLCSYLSVSDSVSFCLSLSLSVCLSLTPYVCLFICLFTHINNYIIMVTEVCN